MARIFMLSEQEEAKAISFVSKILADASQSETIDLQTIVRLSLMKLLGELVIFMGDENPGTAKAVSLVFPLSLRLLHIREADR